MDSYDIKKALPELYRPKPGSFHVVEVPELLFLLVDGHGDPNLSLDYAHAVEGLFALSYGIRALAKTELGRVHTVGPLEGLWSAEDPAAFVSRDKSAWDWTMMICQPPWITPGIVEAARGQTELKRGTPLGHVRFEPYTEGTSVQILHLGSYDSEAPVLARLHTAYLPGNDLTFSGRHHEIYLSDARRTPPEKLRTILRQPVAPIG